MKKLLFVFVSLMVISAPAFAGEAKLKQAVLERYATPKDLETLHKNYKELLNDLYEIQDEKKRSELLYQIVYYAYAAGYEEGNQEAYIPQQRQNFGHSIGKALSIMGTPQGEKYVIKDKMGFQTGSIEKQ